MRFKAALLTIGFLLTSVASTHQQGQQQAAMANLAGIYICEGVNPAGKPYKGIVEVVKMNDVYHLRWTFPGDEIALGIGIASNGVLAVSYYGGATAGVVVYKIGDDQKMVGEWTLVGAEGLKFSEVLTKTDHHAPQVTPSKPKPPSSRKPPTQARSPLMVI